VLAAGNRIREKPWAEGQVGDGRKSIMCGFGVWGRFPSGGPCPSKIEYSKGLRIILAEIKKYLTNMFFTVIVYTLRVYTSLLWFIPEIYVTTSTIFLGEKGY
jgi:hypothetical protein